MKAMVIHEYGDPAVLRLEQVPTPTPAANEVLVKVQAVSINPVDYKRRKNWASQPLPVILGWDIAGTVTQVGPGVTEFQGGDEVFGMVRFPLEGRAYAEYVSAPVTDIAIKPKNLSFEEAAAMTLAPLTAHQAFEVMDLRSGQTVLIHAAAGGVGHYAVQLAKARGARVIATASNRNHDFVLGLGADEVVDYQARPFEEVIGNVDAVLDTVGGDTLPRSFGVIKQGGWLVSIAGKPDADAARQHGIHAQQILVHPSRADLERLSALVEAGQLRSHVSQIFSLEQVVNSAKVVHGVYQIADRLQHVGKPRKREAFTHLVRVHAACSPIVPFHGRGIGNVVPQGLELLIHAPL